MASISVYRLVSRAFNSKRLKCNDSLQHQHMSCQRLAEDHVRLIKNFCILPTLVMLYGRTTPKCQIYLMYNFSKQLQSAVVIIFKVMTYNLFTSLFWCHFDQYNTICCSSSLNLYHLLMVVENSLCIYLILVGRIK